MNKYSRSVYLFTNMRSVELCYIVFCLVMSCSVVSHILLGLALFYIVLPCVKFG